MNPKYKQIIEDYVGGLSLKNTAIKNGCAPGTVRRALHSNGLETRPPSIKITPQVGRSRPSPSPIYHSKEEIRDTAQRKYAIREELALIAIRACEKLGGISHINERYAIIDTQKYKVEVK